MWATFDDSEYPLIRVKLKGKIKNNVDFCNFTTTWESYNSRRTEYIFVFDSREVGYVNMKYAFKMASFIKDLKRKEQYLKSSIIIVENKYLRFLLNLIFKLQKPVADVYMTRDASENHIQRIRNVIYGSYNYDLTQVTVVQSYRKS
tara:strand:+ start:44 stop:481 length:438 start_codon:yes stop_codon:yes gene_type:complete